MKELYTSPELEILCFAPMQGIASDWEQNHALGTSGNVSTEESRPGDYEEPMRPGDIEHM